MDPKEDKALKMGQKGDGLMDRLTDVQMDRFPLCSTGLYSLWGRCPKRDDNVNATIKKSKREAVETRMTLKCHPTLKRVIRKENTSAIKSQQVSISITDKIAKYTTLPLNSTLPYP